MFYNIFLHCIPTTGASISFLSFFYVRIHIFIKRQWRLGKGNLENLVFTCLCARLSLSFHKIGRGSAMATLKTPFSLASALAFHYLCKRNEN